MKQKIAYPQVGQTLSSGYTVMANYDNHCVLARSETAPSPYAVWYLDRDGDTVNGSYYSDLARAQRRFAERCFSEDAIPWSREQLSQAFEKVIERFGSPPSHITIDQGEPNSAVADAREEYKYEHCVKTTVWQVYATILRSLGQSSGRNWMVRFIKDRENAALYQSLAMRQAHFDALHRVDLRTKN